MDGNAGPHGAGAPGVEVLQIGRGQLERGIPAGRQANVAGCPTRTRMSALCSQPGRCRHTGLPPPPLLGIRG